MSLRLLTDAHGQPVPVSTVPFGKPIFDPAEVAERIRRAQRAILSPSTNPKTFLSDGGDGSETAPEITFSRNCVSLDISGPDVVDLSFVDLPGRADCCFLCLLGVLLTASAYFPLRVDR